MAKASPLSKLQLGWRDWRKGDHEAPERLFAVVYPELNRIAARFLHNERDHFTLEPNALVTSFAFDCLGRSRLSITTERISSRSPHK